MTLKRTLEGSSYSVSLPVPSLKWTEQADCSDLSPLHWKVEKWSRSVVSDSATPWTSSLPGFSLHGILQARILEWVAISFSRGSSRPRDRTRVPRIPGRCFNLCASREARVSWLLSASSAGSSCCGCSCALAAARHVCTTLISLQRAHARYPVFIGW